MRGRALVSGPATADEARRLPDAPALARREVLALIAGLAAACGLRAQPGGPPPPGVRGAATRSVAKYLQLERDLLSAIERRDREGIGRVLAADFEARSAASPDATPAADWLQAQLAAPARPRVVRDLWVREFDDIAIVSFVLDDASPPRGRRPETRFVVDVWRQSSAQLLTRNVDVSAHPRPVPPRPSGRE